MSRYWKIILILLIFIYSCSDHTPSSIAILTSGPRGGGYFDSTGKEFGYRIFRNRITNDTIMPVELTIHFTNDSVVLSPADSIPSLGIPKLDRYVKVFLFPDSMLPDKHEEVFDYGISIEPVLNTGLSEPTEQKITIEPKQDYILYIGALLYPSYGRARSELFINGQNLVFKIKIDPPLDSALFPCGQIVFKKLSQ